MKPYLVKTSRYAYFLVAFAAFGARDMCLGNGGPPPPDPPKDPPADASPDGAMTELGPERLERLRNAHLSLG